LFPRFATLVENWANNIMVTYKKGKKSKVVPLRSIEAHMGDRKYSSYCFLTSELEGGEWSASRPGRALPPGKEPPVPIVQEAGWAPEAVWTQRLEEKSSASVGDRTPCRPVRSQTLYWPSYPAHHGHLYNSEKAVYVQLAVIL
jgi:hypothetical protein